MPKLGNGRGRAFHQIGWLFTWPTEEVISYEMDYGKATMKQVQDGYDMNNLVAVRKWTEKDEQAEKVPLLMKTLYFSFGWGHAHCVGGFTYDKDVLVKITAMDPRARMIEIFGIKWSMQYFEPPDPKYYPRGIHELL